ncbi:hypothetical protein [Brevundimonas aurantiaca]|uniref:hypothetical protein n=1 Tax=Brevundimonas aurantiaca TaxID=74316 RepID=UPI00174860C9|nr:hypothetical protein [Brevundimonas aurantiaca]
MKRLNLGYLSAGCLALGVICLAVATGFDTAPSGTHNIGLMQEQMLWSNFGSMMLLIGSVLLVGNRLGNKLDAMKNAEVQGQP